MITHERRDVAAAGGMQAERPDGLLRQAALLEISRVVRVQAALPSGIGVTDWARYRIT